LTDIQTCFRQNGRDRRKYCCTSKRFRFDDRQSGISSSIDWVLFVPFKMKCSIITNWFRSGSEGQTSLWRQSGISWLLFKMKYLIIFSLFVTHKLSNFNLVWIPRMFQVKHRSMFDNQTKQNRVLSFFC
jgi:hypothetical protein